MWNGLCTVLKRELVTGTLLPGCHLDDVLLVCTMRHLVFAASGIVGVYQQIEVHSLRHVSFSICQRTVWALDKRACAASYTVTLLDYEQLFLVFK